MTGPATGPADFDPCPYCGGISGVQATPGTPPGVQAWSCATCRTDWAVSAVNAHLRPVYLPDLIAAVEEIGRLRVALREVIALADDAPTITDSELASRLVTSATACGQLVNSR